MDALAGLLDGPRARGAFVLRSVMDPPWSLSIEDGSPLTLVAVVRGGAVVVRADEETRALAPGDVAVVSGPEPYVVADAPTTAPQVRILPGQRCTTPGGHDLGDAMALGVRTWGNAVDGATVMVTGTYELPTAVSGRLLDALPPALVVRADDWDSPLVGLLATEAARDDPGQEAVLDRLLDLLVIAVLREWFARPGSDAPAWARAQADPVVGRAVGLLHNNPAHPWTVASLASEVGASRAVLARRFREVVGESPIAFLTEWRLTLAADLLREPDATVTSVARAVGYGSPFALSTAFKRQHGLSPDQHRRLDAAAARARPGAPVPTS